MAASLGERAVRGFSRWLTRATDTYWSTRTRSRSCKLDRKATLAFAFHIVPYLDGMLQKAFKPTGSSAGERTS